MPATVRVSPTSYNPPGWTKHRTQAAPEGAPGYTALCPIPGGEGPKTAHQAAPKVPLVDAALCPGPRRRQETRDSMDPTQARRKPLAKGHETRPATCQPPGVYLPMEVGTPA